MKDIDKKNVKASITSALAFLRSRQLPYGEFRSYRYTDPALKSERIFDSSPFATAFVVYALGFVDEPPSSELIRKGVQFVLEERQESGVWSYWSSRNTATIEPDLDVTCCAADVVRRFAPDRHDDRIRDAILENRTLRGTFKTWLRPLHDTNDVGAAVNANVILYLGECEETQSAIEYLNRLILEGREEAADWYYPDTMALYYMVSRAYYEGVGAFETCMATVAERTRTRQTADGGFGDALQTGMALSTLLNAGIAPGTVLESGVRHLLDVQSDDGSWASCPFYAGPEPPGPHKFWWGSEEFTTALCLEALARIAKA